MISMRRLWSALAKPAPTVRPVFMVIIGGIALILGDHASKAFTNLGGATLIRVLGFTLLTGGTIVIVGIVRADPVMEPIGLAFATLGSLLYGAGAIAGLGTQGLIAGLFALAVAAAFGDRIRAVVTEAHTRE